MPFLRRLVVYTLHVGSPPRRLLLPAGSLRTLSLAKEPGGPVTSEQTSVSRSTPPGVAVTVCVPTYQRLHLLGDLIPTLLLQCQESASAGHPARIWIIDNDPLKSAQELVSRFPDVTYSAEPTPGLAAVRNHALDRCPTRLLAFIDDDETPSSGWLTSLLDTWRATGAQAVAGQVQSRFLEPLDPWVAAGDFWRRRSLPTGTPVSTAACGNLLLDIGFVRSAGLRFSERFALTGGEDSFFSTQLSKAGGRIVWCNESVALDLVPPHRTTRSWLRQRRIRSGNTVARVALLSARDERGALRILLAGRGLIRFGGGAMRRVAGTIARSQRHQARGFSTMYRGYGMMAGAAGFTYAEYDRTGRTWHRERAHP